MTTRRVERRRRPRGGPSAASKAGNDERRYLPLKFSVGWLAGTYLLFLLTPYREDAQNVELLTAFIAAAIGAFILGYLLGMSRSRRVLPAVETNPQTSGAARMVIVLGAIWFIVFGFASLEQFGATGIADIIDAALNPGDRYRAKFAVFEELQTSGATSLPLQLTSWSGVFFALLLPYVVFHWRGLGGAMRTLVIAALLPYLAFYIYIGTIKGIGDLLVLAAAAFIACYGLHRRDRKDGRTAYRGVEQAPLTPAVVRETKHAPRRALKFGLVAGGVVFVAVMANLLGGRAVDLNRYPPIPVITELFGQRFSAGLMTIWIYPTNGYTGLSQELTMPFVFSGGASMPVFAPILGKLFGVADPMLLSYPVRNEAANGWSATMTWSTAYASVASDLTFLGTIGAMGLLGWMIAYFWMGVRRSRDPLALAIFSLLVFVVAYIPANNQIFMTRYTATGLVTLLIVYLLRGIFRPRRGASARRPDPERKETGAELVRTQYGP